MRANQNLGNLLFYFGLCGMCAGFLQESCTNYRRQFDRVFSVPGDMAMVKTTLISPYVFNSSAVPYNISWYNAQTGQEMRDQPGRIMVRGETLWFLKILLDDAGDYVTVVRTPSQCYRECTMLVVDQPTPGQCGRPKTVGQVLTNGVTDTLSCPLRDYINKLDSYNISSSIKWYKGCEPLVYRTEKYIYRDATTLIIKAVDAQDNHNYTCTLTATIGGVTRTISETIDAWVRGEYSMAPQVIKPTNTTITVPVGSNFSQLCRVFVPGVGLPFVDIVWFSGGAFIDSYDPSDRVYTTLQPLQFQDSPKEGVWLEVLLTFSELKEEDFYINYTCQAQSSRGHPQAYFTLMPADPNMMIPIGSVFGCVTLLFVVSVVVSYLFKVDMVLWFRRTFPLLYKNKDLDGMLYDAYVAYPQPGADGFNEEVAAFALHTLPQVLEKACGYKLFIAGRDCQPGQAIIDSVEENIQASRRLLLLYTASTFTSKRLTSSSSSSSNNNNLTKNNNSDDDDNDQVHQDPRQQLECLVAMHRSLLEGSLKVVLVELEEISPAQLAVFPESVQHLRKKQGAVCWWKNRRTRPRWRTCVTRTGGEERGGQETRPSPSHSPSSRFWKEIRYHMPARGKRALYPEKTALLNI